MTLYEYLIALEVSDEERDRVDNDLTTLEKKWTFCANAPYLGYSFWGVDLKNYWGWDPLLTCNVVQAALDDVLQLKERFHLSGFPFLAERTEEGSVWASGQVLFGFFQWLPENAPASEGIFDLLQNAGVPVSPSQGRNYVYDFDPVLLTLEEIADCPAGEIHFVFDEDEHRAAVGILLHALLGTHASEFLARVASANQFLPDIMGALMDQNNPNPCFTIAWDDAMEDLDRERISIRRFTKQ